MTPIQLAAFIVGMVLGGAMILISSIVYFRKQSFGMGGSVLTVFGTILVGLSIFTSIDFSWSPTDGLRFQAEIYNAAQDAAKEAIHQVAQAEANASLSGHSWTADSGPGKGNLESETDLGGGKSSDDLLAANTTTGTLARLQRQEQVQRLLDSKNFQKAMELDPENVLPVMYYIEQSVQRAQYDQAIAHFTALRDNNRSGVGFSVYPDVALAMERSGKGQEASKVLEELKNAIAKDIAQGYGYLSRSQQLEWLDKSLAKSESLGSDGQFNQKVADLRAYIGDTIAKLRK